MLWALLPLSFNLITVGGIPWRAHWANPVAARDFFFIKIGCGIVIRKNAVKKLALLNSFFSYNQFLFNFLYPHLNVFKCLGRNIIKGNHPEAKKSSFFSDNKKTSNFFVGLIFFIKRITWLVIQKTFSAILIWKKKYEFSRSHWEKWNDTKKIL